MLCVEKQCQSTRALCIGFTHGHADNKEDVDNEKHWIEGRKKQKLAVYPTQ